MTAKTKKQRIIDDVTEQISTGRLQPGSQLPTTPELQAVYDCSVPTVRAAMALLQAARLVEFVPGAGMFVKQK